MLVFLRNEIIQEHVFEGMANITHVFLKKMIDEIFVAIVPITVNPRLEVDLLSF